MGVMPRNDSGTPAYVPTGPRYLAFARTVYERCSEWTGSPSAVEVVAVDALLSDEALERVAHAAGRALMALTRDHRLGLARDIVEAALAAALPGTEAP